MLPSNDEWLIEQPLEFAGNVARVSAETLLGTDTTLSLHRGHGDDGSPMLLLVPHAAHAEHPPVEMLRRMLGIRDRLAPSWAGVPLAIAQRPQASALLYADPGGESLLRHLSTPARPDDFLRLAIAITTAVGKLHDAHLLHLNLRPALILITASCGTAHVLGIDSIPESERRPGQVHWTLARPGDRTGSDHEGTDAARNARHTGSGAMRAYLAPEQTGRMNRIVDQRTDLYALGVILYQLLTGTLPFEETDPLAWIHCLIARQPPPPEAHRPDIPPMLASIVMKLLAKTPDERYQSAYGLAHDLKRCQSDLSAHQPIERFPLGNHDQPGVLHFPDELYGRTPERDALLRAFQAVSDGAGLRVFVISGYSGIGKSCLVRSLDKKLTTSQGFYVSGKFDQYQRDVPYASFAQAFRALFGQILALPESALQPWRAAVQHALGNQGRIITGLIPELIHLIGEQPPVPEIGPSEDQNRFQAVFQRFLSVFTRKGQPLVMFLDDLQWIDAASLRLLEHLTHHPDVHDLLLIITYRSNEVDAAHPLALFLDRLSHSGVSRSTLELAPLDLADLAQLIGDTLGRDDEAVEGLARLVLEKTGGNPFFARQFLANLHETGLITYQPHSERWHWDLTRIRAQNYTDNVVDFMVGKLSRLKPATQDALQRFACIGNTARTDLLARMSVDTVSDPHGALSEAMDVGLITLAGDTYRFLHDRVQEAAYSMIPVTERPARHLEIGRLLLGGADVGTIERDVFTIVNQFNANLAQISLATERATVSHLNRRAGQRARAATDNYAARHYLRHAMQLQADDHWQAYYADSMALYLELSEAEYLTGDFDSASALFDEILRHANTFADQARAHRLQMRLLVVSGRYEAAVNIAFQALKCFGIDLPDDDARIEARFRAAHARISAHMQNRPIADLADLPVVTDPSIKAIMSLLVDATVCAYIARPAMFRWLVTAALELCLEHGNTADASFFYGRYGRLLVSTFQEIPAAFAYSALSLQLNDRFRNIRLSGTLLYNHGAFIHAWQRHISTCIPYMRRAFDASLEVGDLVYANYNGVFTVWQMVEKGDPLSTVRAQSETFAQFARQTRNEVVFYILRLFQQFIAGLTGDTPEPSNWNSDDFSEADYLTVIDRAAYVSGFAWFHILKQIAHYLSGDAAASLRHAASAKPFLHGVMAQPFEATHYFFEALAHCAQAQAHPGDTPAQPETLHDLRTRLALWAHHCPENYLNRHALVEAECAALEHRHDEAMDGYERAIRSANENGFVQQAAIAFERAARYYRSRGFERIASAHLTPAVQAYHRWGARAKVVMLSPHTSKGADGLPHTGDWNTQVNLLSVTKASQALSGEIRLAQLLKTLLTLVVEHAGADRALLLLNNETDIKIEAEAIATAHGIDVDLKPGTDLANRLPESVLNYVSRTGEPLLFDDARTAASHRDDPYLQASDVRALLCLPLLRGARLVGAMYLENRLTVGAFSTDGMGVLELIASQAAISLENARLYRDLEVENSER